MHTNKLFKNGRTRLALALLVALGVVAAGAYLKLRGGGPGDGAMQFFAVAEGPLVISVTGAGTVKPSAQAVIKSQLEGRSSILFLVPEGKRVREGDLLVELDASQITDSRVEQLMRVGNAEASFIQSRENLEVVRSATQAAVEKAELNLRFSGEDLKKYQDGEYPNRQKSLQADIIIAQERLQRAKDKLDWSRKLHAEKYLSDTELQADELEAKQAELNLELARNNLRLLEDYTYKRQVDQFTSDIRQATMALERERRKAEADVLQAEAQLKARESEFFRQREKLEKIDAQIARAKVHAPTDGVVVYATSAQFSYRGNVEPLAEGQEVRERQELIYLPTADTFLAVTKVHESNIKKIGLDMPVRVTFDALPGTVLSGRVARIAPLPDPQSMFMNPDLKVYTTEIEIEGGASVLRTGMNCQVEIIVARHEKAMYAPVQCVVRVGGVPTVYLRNGGPGVPRAVKIGLDNNTMVHLLVLDGTKGLGSVPVTISIVRDEVKLTDQEASSRMLETNPDGERLAKDAAAAGPVLKMSLVTLPSFYSDFGAKRNGDGEFTSSTKDVARLVAEARRQNADGIFLDLRGNGGGSLDEAISLTGIFLPAGPVVQVRDAERRVRVRNQEENPDSYAGPLIVLVDRLSASASEIVAAALQDHRRALVVGDRRTHGKGTVQTVYPLANVFRSSSLFKERKPGALKFTIAQFYRCNGGSTQSQGVVPDVIFPSFWDHMEIGEADLPHAMAWDQIPPVDFKPAQDITPFIPTLIQRSWKRTEVSPEHRERTQKINEFEIRRQRKTITLNREARQLLQKEDEDWAEALRRLNNRRRPRQAAPAATADKPAGATAAKAAPEETPDPVLDEALRIMADMVALYKGRTLAVPPAAEIAGQPAPAAVAEPEGKTAAGGAELPAR